LTQGIKQIVQILVKSKNNLLFKKSDASPLNGLMEIVDSRN